MNARRIIALLAALPTATLVAGCASSTAGNGQAGSGSGSTSVKSPSSGHPTDAAGLGHLMQSAISGVTSAKFTLAVSAAGLDITGSGSEQLSNGKLVAIDVKESVPGAGEVEIIVTGGKTYAKLPTGANGTGKPWVLVTTGSSNPVVQQLASTMQQTLSSASISSYTTFITAAKSVKYDGQQAVGGVDTAHYTVVVDVTKLPDSLPGKDALIQSGLSDLPVELYVDAQGRSWQVTEDLSVQGQSVQTRFTITGYNVPVTITAPPADQVSTG